MAGNTSLCMDFWVPASLYQDNSWSKTACHLLILARILTPIQVREREREEQGTFRRVGDGEGTHPVTRILVCIVEFNWLAA